MSLLRQQRRNIQTTKKYDAVGLSTPTTCASSGWATLVSTTDAEAPGNTPVTVPCGGTIAGNCATGIFAAASAPAMEIMNAMTIARRGRSTKTAEIMGFCPPAERHRRAFWCDRHPRPPCWIRPAHSLVPAQRAGRLEHVVTLQRSPYHPT